MNAPKQAGLPPLPLKDPNLFRDQCYLDGAWTGADSKKTFAVNNPASGAILGTVPDLGAAETRRAIEAAERALPAWRARTAKERSAVLRKWNDLILANLDDLALILTTEQGKPLAGAKVSVWQTSEDGRYDVEFGEAIDMRGVFETDAKGNYLLKTTKPLGYYIPLDGPVGDMIRAQQRHGMRPAHIHFLISAPGYRELVTALYLKGDQHLEDDVVFGAAGDLVAEIKDADPNNPLPGHKSIQFDFQLARQSDADKLTGRVGADPSAIVKAAE